VTTSELLVPRGKITKAKLLFRRVAEEVHGAARIVDMAVGSGQTLARSLAANPFVDLDQVIAIDLWRPSLHVARTRWRVPHVVQADARRLPLPDRSVDVALLLDAIEHFPADEVPGLLAEARRVARTKILVYTPNGFMEQGEEGGNPYQAHHSGWTPAALRDLGFEVEGHGVNVERAKHHVATGGTSTDDPADLALALFGVMRLREARG